MKLQPFEEICSHCGGDGFQERERHPKWFPHKCNKCKGTGKLDWLEKIFGKKKLEDCCDSSGLVFIDSEEKMYEVFGVPGQ